MAVNLTTLFTRLGALIDLGDKIDINQAEMVTEIDDILDEYANDRDLAFILQQQLPSYVSAQGTALTALAGVIRATIIDMVHTDDPLPGLDLVQALDRLHEQMVTADTDIDETTVSASVSVAGLVSGNGKMVVRLIDGLGEALQYARAEDIIVRCTTDGQEASANLGVETFSVAGELSLANLHEDWPAGSGIGAAIIVTDPAVDSGTGGGKNRGINTDFEDFTSGIPDSWTREAGVADTDIKKTTTKLRGTNALEFAGDGSTKPAISEVITVAPETVYCIGLWVRDDGTGPAAGVLRASLQDSGGAVYNASSSLTTASVSVTLSGVGSTYAFSSIMFETPRDLPAGGSSAELWLELTTALTNGRSVFIDGMFIAEVRQFGGLGGPFMLITPGSADFIRGDFFKATITNNNEGEFVRGLDRYLNLYSLGKYIRSVADGSETISDTLVA